MVPATPHNMQGTPGSTQASSVSSDPVHQWSQGGTHLQNAPLRPPPPPSPPPSGHSQDHIHKAFSGHPSLCPPHVRSGLQRLMQGPARWLCVHDSRCMSTPLWGFPEPGDRRMGEGAPASKAIYTFVRMRMHCLGNILHGVRPQPAPFQNKGRGRWRAHIQAGLTQGRGMTEGRAELPRWPRSGAGTLQA